MKKQRSATLRQLSIMCGRHPSYFSSIKHNNRKKFNYIFSFDKNEHNSIQKYFSHTYKMQSFISDMYYELEETKQKRKVAKEISKRLNIDIESVIKRIEYLAFGQDDPLSFTYKGIKDLEFYYNFLKEWYEKEYR